MEVCLPLLSALPRDCGTFRFDTMSAFNATSFIYTLKRTIPSVRESFTAPSTHRSTFSTGILTGSSIGFALRLILRSRLTLIRLALIRKPWSFGEEVFRLLYRYLYLHLLFPKLHIKLSLCFYAAAMLPYQLQFLAIPRLRHRT